MVSVRMKKTTTNSYLNALKRPMSQASILETFHLYQKLSPYPFVTKPRECREHHLTTVPYIVKDSITYLISILEPSFLISCTADRHICAFSWNSILLTIDSNAKYKFIEVSHCWRYTIPSYIRFSQILDNTLIALSFLLTPDTKSESTRSGKGSIQIFAGGIQYSQHWKPPFGDYIYFSARLYSLATPCP